MFIEQAAKLFDFFPGAALRRKGMKHQFAGGPVEDALQHVRGELALGLFGGLLRFIDVRALVFVTPHQSFGGHNLHEFQNGGVAESLLFVEGVVDFADGGRPAIPEHLKDLQLGGGRFL